MDLASFDLTVIWVEFPEIYTQDKLIGLSLMSFFDGGCWAPANMQPAGHATSPQLVHSQSSPSQMMLFHHARKVQQTET